jgi:hypothetical protein
MAENFPAASTGAVMLRSAKGATVLGWAPAGPWKFQPGAFGGYGTVARTARRARTAYTGVDAVSMSGTLLLDGWSQQKAVAPMRRHLQAMASPSGPQELTPPQAVFVTGCVELPGRWWVIASLEAGDVTLLRPTDGVLLRQNFEIVLVPPPVDGVIAMNGKRYVTRKGDSTQRVASTQLGKASRAREIKLTNGKPVRDVRRVLPVGTVLILP